MWPWNKEKGLRPLVQHSLQADSFISRGNVIYQQWKYNLSAVVVHSRFSDTEMQFITCRNVISTLEQ
jgi:hypothetical protein